jgi:capsular polysaccharide transport system permease protein
MTQSAQQLPVPVPDQPPALPAKAVPQVVQTQVTHLRPPARAARVRRRHWRLISSFVILVLQPILAVAAYLWIATEDQYASVTGFTIRQEEGGNASELLGGLQLLGGTNSASDGDILYEFILSQSLVEAVDTRLGLVDHFSQHWNTDPVFSLWPNPTVEDLQWYWQRTVRVSFDARTGLTEVQVLAFSPDMAQSIAAEILSQSQDMINDLNEQARSDAMRYANADLQEALTRLKSAREALTAFRSRTQIVDPEADLQGRMGVMNNLQQQLAEALIDYDMLKMTSNRNNDPRIEQASRRIDVIRERIGEERRNFASEDSETQAGDYPSLIAEYEGLVVDREFAEETYRAALAAVDMARAKAERQSRYLATYIDPTLPERSQYPQRMMITGLVALFALFGWAVLVMIYYSIRDRA